MKKAAQTHGAGSKEPCEMKNVKGLSLSENADSTRRESATPARIMKMASIRKTSLLLLLCNVIWLASCNPCRDTVKLRVKSVDGQLVANVYERDCGATTDFSSSVNVQRSSDKFRGNEGRLFFAKGRYDVSVAWTGPRTLLITCAHCSRKNVYREVVALGDIDVIYNLGPSQ